MLKKLKLLFSLLLVTGIVSSQQVSLHYFINPKDSLCGVKDSNGNIIIPAKYNLLNINDEEAAITDSIIIFYANNLKGNPTSASYGDAFNRLGKFLYHPMVYDNGPDYFSESYARCVNNGKVGFVNLLGEVVIKPQWDWVSPFNYGYALACNDCVWDKQKDPEHPPLVFKNPKEVFYINASGNIVQPVKHATLDKDQPLEDGNHLPYPFTYTVKEQALVDSMNNMEIISKVHFVNYADVKTAGKEGKIQFEIIQRPSMQLPFYILQGYRYNNMYYNEDRLIFYYTTDGQLLHYDLFEKKQTPYNEWLKEALLSSEAYLKNHPDAPNKFNVQAYLKEIN
ncbi:MAG: WG repeat-containing protein [Niabella sp.]